MAFDRERFNNVSSGAGSQMKIWTYKNTSDSLATIQASGYFNPMRFALNTNDVIYIVGSDGSKQISVTSALNASTVTTVTYSDGGAPDDGYYWVGQDSGLSNQVDVSSLSAATVAAADKILGLDADDSDNPKTFTAQSIADLAPAAVSGGNNFINQKVISHVNATGSTSSLAVTASRLYYIPIEIEKEATFTRIGIDVDLGFTASEVARLGIYNQSSTTGYPDTVLLDAGTVAIDSTGVKEITISQVLSGKYYLAVTCQRAGTGNLANNAITPIVSWYGLNSTTAGGDVDVIYEASIDPTTSLPTATPGNFAELGTAGPRVFVRIA